MTSRRVVIRSTSLFEHDLFRKPVATFRDHALKPSETPADTGPAARGHGWRHPALARPDAAVGIVDVPGIDLLRHRQGFAITALGGGGLRRRPRGRLRRGLRDLLPGVRGLCRSRL